MPGGDRTGPLGMGAMTGRAAGYCTGNGVPGYANPIAGRGFGRGFGFGRGDGFGIGFRGGRRGWWGVPPYTATPSVSPQQTVDVLKNQAQYLENALEGIKKQITELEDDDKK